MGIVKWPVLCAKLEECDTNHKNVELIIWTLLALCHLWGWVTGYLKVFEILNILDLWSWAKVSKLDLEGFIKQYILQVDVAMDHITFM